jgi:hypothetical protein
MMEKQMKKIYNYFLFLTIFLVSNVYAITVSEIDFDNFISFNPSSSTVGALNFGINTISGSLGADCVSADGFIDGFICDSGPRSDDQDSFILEIGPGLKIDSLFVTTSNFVGPANFSSDASLGTIRAGPSSPLFSRIVSSGPILPNSTTGNLITSAIGPGVYSASVGGGRSSEAGPFTMDYSVKINVSSVPIPAAVWLFAFGLIGLIGMRKNSSKVFARRV